jgi:MFS family permease
VPVGIAVVFAALKLLPRHIGEENKKLKLDAVGAVLATTGLMSLVYGLSKAPSLGWDSSTVLGFIAAGVGLFTAFLYYETKTDQPMMPLKIFKIRNVLGANLAFLSIACTMFSMFFFLTLYIQQVLGYSPIKTGVSFLPVTFIIGITSAVVSIFVGKIGYKPFMALGPIVLALGLYLMSNTLKVHGNYWHNVFPGLAVCALGMGLTFVAGTLAATSGVPKHFSGLASGVLNTAQQVGGALGLGILSAVAFSASHEEIAAGAPALGAQVHGYQAGLMVGVALAVLASVIVLLVVKNHKVDAKEAMQMG